MHSHLRLILAVLFAPLALLGCGGGEGSGGPTVVATTTMLGDVAGKLLDGTGVRVVVLMQPGVDPHGYEMKATDAKQMQSADLVVFNGLNLEGKMAQTLSSLGNAYAAAEAVPEDRLIGAQQYEGAYDPHVWMDVGLWAEHVVGGVGQRLREQFPQHAEAISANESAYLKELAGLDNYARTAIGLIPEGQRHLITAHDAFGYFGRAYDIDVHGVQGISTVSEAGVADIERLTSFIVDHNVPAVFVETSVSSKPIEKLVEGVEARGKQVELAPAIYSDSTGPAGTFEGTYLGMLDHNITTIARELGAQGVDIHGFSGQLTQGHDHEHEDHD